MSQLKERTKVLAPLKDDRLPTRDGEVALSRNLNLRLGDHSNIPQTDLIMATFHVDLFGTEIDIRNLYYALDLVYPNLKVPSGNKKASLDYLGAPNIPFSIQYGYRFRGIVTSSNKRYLKNSTCLQITSSSRNVYLRIQKNSIGVSGATSLKEVEEVIGYLFKRMETVQYVLDKIPESDLVENTLEWVEKSTRGPRKSIIRNTRMIASEQEERTDLIERDTLKVPREYRTGQYPPEVDSEIAWFLINKIFDFYFHQNYSQAMRALVRMSHIYRRTQIPSRVNQTSMNDFRGHHFQYQAKTSMIYINFDLNFPIDLDQLYLLDREYFGDFVLVQNDDNTSFIKLKIKYQVPEHLKDQIKINPRKTPVHTFQIFSKGRVTLTGPHERLNFEAYIKFLKFIYSVESKIRKD